MNLELNFVDEVSTDKNKYIVNIDGVNYTAYINSDRTISVEGTKLNAETMNKIVDAINEAYDEYNITLDKALYNLGAFDSVVDNGDGTVAISRNNGAYNETVAKGVPLITLDSQGSKWLTDEWKQGLQLWDEQWEVGSLDDNGNEIENSLTIRTKNYIPIKPNTTYYFNPTYYDVYTYDKGLNFVGYYDDLNNGNTFTVGSNEYYLKFRLSQSYGATYKNDIMLSNGIYPYQPYNANKHITNFEADFLKEESLKSGNKFAWDKTCQIESTAEFQSFSKTDSSFTAVLYASNWLKLPTYLVGLTPNQTYTISAVIDKHGGIHNVGFRHSDEANEIALLRDATDGFLSLTFTPTESTYYLEFYCNYGTSNAGTVSFNNIMLNKGSTAQPYHEYQGSIVRSKELNNRLDTMQSNMNANHNTVVNLYYELEEKLEFTMGSVYDSYERFIRGTGIQSGVTYYYSGKLQTYKNLSTKPTISNGTLAYNASNGVIDYTLSGGNSNLSGTITIKYNMMELWNNRNTTID